MAPPVRPAARGDLDLFIDVRLRALATNPSAFGSTLAREEVLSREAWLADLERILD